MNGRFVIYLKSKGLSQKEISELSCVSAATVSRFCSGSPISSDKLLRLLQVCDDLSLDWLFFGTGDMVRSRTCDSYTFNMGSFSGSDISHDHSVNIRSSPGAQVGSLSRMDVDLLLAEKDRVISERDATIGKLNEILVRHFSEKP